MPTMIVPRSFFESERDNLYSNWFVSYWRELVSNCIDAGADGIKIRTFFASHKDESVFRVVVQDNGKGMDLDTIENVYMRLGASTKADEADGVGGFGRARVLTTLSHLRYSIASGDIVVDGSGTEFNIRPSLKPIKGCAIIVDIDPRYAPKLQAGLFEFLDASNVPARISLDLAHRTLDGLDMKLPAGAEEGKPTLWRPRFARGKALSQFSDDVGPWADIWVNATDRALKHQLLVRVHGLCMHSEYLSEPIQVTVDLIPARSRHAMTVSRDSLRWNFRSSLMKFVQRLATDVVSATRVKKERIDVRLSGRNGPMVLSRPGKTVAPAPRVELMQAEVTSEANYAVVAKHSDATSPLPGVVNTAQEEVGPSLLQYDFHLLTEDPTAEQKRVAWKYNPDSWLKAASQGDNQQGFYGRRLLALWTKAMEISVQRMFEQHPDLPDTISMRCGFVIGEHVGAKLVTLDDGAFVALLNPVDTAGHIAFRLSNAQDRKKIFTIANHEACHLLVDLHNEYYAKALTDLVGSFRDPEIDRELRAVIADVGDDIRDSKATMTPAPETTPDGP